MKRIVVLFAVFHGALAVAQPVSITVPSRPAWCVSSQPIALEPDQGSTRFGDLLFYELYQRLERAALKAAVPSLGVPFLDSAKEQPALAPAAPAHTPPAGLAAAATVTASGPAVATVTPAAPQAKYVMRVCANVGPSIPAPDVALKVEPVVFNAATVYAALCNANDDGLCRQELRKRVQSDKKLTDDQAAKLEFSASQSIDGKADAASLLNSLTDYSVRPLKEGMPLPNVPRDKLILWMAQ
jgi:hypothetical protein